MIKSFKLFFLLTPTNRTLTFCRRIFCHIFFTCLQPFLSFSLVISKWETIFCNISRFTKIKAFYILSRSVESFINLRYYHFESFIQYSKLFHFAMIFSCFVHKKQQKRQTPKLTFKFHLSGKVVCGWRCDVMVLVGGEMMKFSFNAEEEREKFALNFPVRHKIRLKE